MPVIVDLSASGGHSLLLRNHEKLLDLFGSDRPPTAEEREFAPKELIAEPPRSRRMPQVFGSYKAWFICPILHDWLEELEPGVHDYFPVKVRTTGPVEDKTDHGTYYLLAPPPAVEGAVVIEETEFWSVIGGRLSPVVDVSVTIRASAAKGRHLWSLAQKHGAQVVCSDELWGRMKLAKFKGLSVYKKVKLKD